MLFNATMGFTFIGVDQEISTKVKKNSGLALHILHSRSNTQT